MLENRPMTDAFTDTLLALIPAPGEGYGLRVVAAANVVGCYEVVLTVSPAYSSRAAAQAAATDLRASLDEVAR